MNTATMNYKEIFKLAESKGFRSKIECIDYRSLPDNETLSLLYATQIQKWLRDSKQIFVCVDYRQNTDELKNINPFDYNIFREGEYRIYTVGKYTTYESALLHGIEKALPLI